MIIHCDTTRYIWEVLENNEYSFLFSNLRVLDLGCNIGAFSLWIYPQSSRIWAVDMDQKPLDLFKETIKENDLNKITLYKDRVVDLNDFMSGHSITDIDVLKIDVEGDEYEILNQKDFPTNNVATIIGEYHQDSPENRLNALGYSYIELPGKHFLSRRLG